MKETHKMNIQTSSQSATDTAQTQQKVNDVQASASTEKTNNPQKVEDKKSENNSENSNDFKKFLDEQKSTDKIAVDPSQQNNLNPNMPNQEYINKFGFETVSGFKNMKSSYNYDSVKISKDDAKFFADMVENKQFALQKNGDTTNLIKFADEIGPTYKSQETSKVLTDLINKAYNDQKPVRIDFDNKVSVILKVDAKGKVSAEFIPGDKAVEAYLKSNIDSLKQRFDDQNLPYNDILYKQSGNGNQRERQKQQQENKGE